MFEFDYTGRETMMAGADFTSPFMKRLATRGRPREGQVAVNNTASRIGDPVRNVGSRPVSLRFNT